MKPQPDQFNLTLEIDPARAPLALEPETTSAPPPAGNEQPDLLTAPPQPPARNLAEWERRQHGSFRARQARRRILQRAGPDPILV